MVKKLFYSHLLILLITLFCFSSFAQISINKPVLSFTDICASPSFNNFAMSFVFSPTANLQSGNIFKIELSDGTGSFANPTQLTTSTSTSSPVIISFQLPTNTNGAAYKIRVKSTAPAATSPSSDPFPALFKPFEQGFKINNEVANQSFCENSTYNLTITPDVNGNTPTTFPQLTYLWFKNNTLIPGEIGASLPVTTAGTYYCKVNYGNCPSNSQSNAVTMTTVPAQILTISSPTTLLCDPAGIVMSSSLVSNSYVYEWYKNNFPIANSNSATYTATLAGDYTLKIINNNCITSSNIITLTTQDFNVSLNSSSGTTIIPGQNFTLNALTNAASPNYSWERGGVSVGGNQASFTSNLAGTYKVIVNQTTGCVSQKEASIIVNYPTNYGLTIANQNPYTDCENTSVTMKATSFVANSTLDVLTSNAPIIYQWFKNGGPVLNANSNTLTVSNFINNGVYVLKATLSNGEIVTSNPISILLKFTEVVTISANRNLLCNAFPTVTITPSITNSLYTYAWYKLGNTTSLSGNQVLNASAEGDYYLKFSFQGCSVSSNIITIKRLSTADLVTDPVSNEIVINNGQSLTITASGGDSYVWSVEGQPNVTTPIFNVTQPETITLVGTFGSCTIEKIFIVTLNRNVSNPFIPNAITPNSDGSNDTWIIPEEFAYKDDVEIVIFTSKQEILFQSKNYLQNWPITPVQENSVYYYKIMKDSSVLEKGTISILK
jgi:CHU_C Type IX secretion signal domain